MVWLVNFDERTSPIEPVGGLKIGKEAGEWTASNYHPYLPSEVYLTCRFFSARKHGLVDAVVRSSSAEKTAVVALPGGIGTLDENFSSMIVRFGVLSRRESFHLFGRFVVATLRLYHIWRSFITKC